MANDYQGVAVNGTDLYVHAARATNPAANDVILNNGNSPSWVPAGQLMRISQVATAAQVTALQNQDTIILSDIGNLKSRATTLESDVADLESDVTALQSESDTVTATLATHTTAISDLEESVTQLSDDAVSLATTVSAIESEVMANTTRIVALQRMETDHFVDFTTSRWARWATGTGAGAYLSSMIYVGPTTSMYGPGVIRVTGGSATNGRATMRSGAEQQIILTHGFEAEWFGKIALNVGGGVVRFGFGRITSGVTPSANPYAYCEINAGDGDAWLLTDDGTNTDSDSISYTGNSNSTGDAHRYKLRVEGTSLQFFIDDVLTMTAADYVPVDDRTKSLSFFLSVDGLTSTSFPLVDIDWIRMGVA